jgi:hypothetical protein
VGAKDGFKVRESFLPVGGEHQVSAIDMGKVPDSSTEPLEFLTLLVHHLIKLSAYNHNREVIREHSFRILMASPLLLHQLLNFPCSLLLQFREDLLHVLSNCVQPKLKIH